MRARIHGRLGEARLALPIDIGFGDVITPGPEEQDYPTLPGKVDVCVEHFAAQAAGDSGGGGPKRCS